MLYRFFADLLQPLPILLLSSLVALLYCWWSTPQPRKRFRALLLVWMLLYTYCAPISAYFLAGTLEWSYPPSLLASDPSARTIAVLGGEVRRPDGVRQSAELGCSTLIRCLHGAAIYRDRPGSKILLSGGIVDPRRSGPPAAELMRDFLLRLGVHERDVFMQRRSRSTYEDALFSAEVLRQRDIESIVLVTDAIHLERSVRCFRAQGIDVTPSGCGHRATSLPQPLLFALIPSAQAAQLNEDVFHEWIGILWYWWHGRI